VTQTYEIVPGRSIGPFELGMTRAQVEGLSIRPMRRLENGSHYYPLIEVTEARLAEMVGFPSSGVTVSFDGDGRCRKISALFGYSKEPPLFSLLGEVVNGMKYTRSLLLLESIATDVKCGYGSVSSASAGVSATKWEYIDEEIVCVAVEPAAPVAPAGRPS
jgi:hypothetical protein